MKKILSLFLLLTILMQLFSFTVYAADDVIMGKTEIEFISKLNIISNWEASDIITRAEFVNAAVRCFIKDSGAKDGTSVVNAPSAVFGDVASDYWAAYNIDIAKKSGIISGNENGMFDPDGYLSYPAALKIALNILGYTPAAEQKGGFPVGYILTANKIGISLPSVENSNIMTKGEAAIILKNMLETAPMQHVYNVGATEAFMPEKDEDTILNNAYAIRSFSGIVTSTQYSSVDSTQNTDAGTVRIKSESNGRSALFEVGETKASDYLGRRITVYYYDDTPYKLFYIEADDGKELIINSEDFIDASYSERKIEYKVTEETDCYETQTTKKSIKISSDADIIHNGIFTSNVKDIFDILNDKTESNLDYIAFYDNDDDSKFDVVKINTYYTIHVDYVHDDENRLVITDNTISKSVSIDKTNIDVFVKRYTADGYSMDGYGIVEGDTVGVSYANGEAELYSLYISKTVKSDIIKAISGKKLLSEGHEYNFSNALLKYYEDKDLSNSITCNDEYDLYIDHNGYVSGFYSKEVGFDTYYDIVKNKDEFIYIIDTDVENSGLKRNIIHFRTVNLEAEINIMTSAEKLTIDGVTVKDGGALSVEAAREKVKGKLVKYKKDSNGYIKSITLPLTDTEDNQFSYTIGFNQEDGPVELRYRAGPKTFYKDGLGACSINSKTTILWVPHDELLEKGADINLYCKRGTTSNFTSDQYYYVNTYKLNNSSVTADILIAYNKGEYRIDSFTRPIIVREVRQSTNNYGKPGYKIYGIQDNKEVEVVSEQNNFKNRYGVDVEVGVGDLVRCSFNAKGDCCVLNVLYDHSNYEAVTSSYSSGYRAVRGSVYHHDSNAMLMIKNKWDITDADILPSNMESQVCTSSAKIYIFDSEDNTLTKVSSGSLVDYKFDNVNYSRVVVANSFASPDLIIIYK